MNNMALERRGALSAALYANKTFVHIDDAIELKKNDSDAVFFCPNMQCRSQLAIVISDTGAVIPHFRHPKIEGCDSSERNTAIALHVIRCAFNRQATIDIKMPCSDCESVILTPLTQLFDWAQWDETEAGIVLFRHGQPSLNIFLDPVLPEQASKSQNRWISFDVTEILQSMHHSNYVWSLVDASARKPVLCSRCTTFIKRAVLEPNFRMQYLTKTLRLVPQCIELSDVNRSVLFEAPTYYAEQLLENLPESLRLANSDKWQLALTQLCIKAFYIAEQRLESARSYLPAGLYQRMILTLASHSRRSRGYHKGPYLAYRSHSRLRIDTNPTMTIRLDRHSISTLEAVTTVDFNVLEHPRMSLVKVLAARPDLAVDHWMEHIDAAMMSDAHNGYAIAYYAMKHTNRWHDDQLLLLIASCWPALIVRMWMQYQLRQAVPKRKLTDDEMDCLYLLLDRFTIQRIKDDFIYACWPRLSGTSRQKLWYGQASLYAQILMNVEWVSTEHYQVAVMRYPDLLCRVGAHHYVTDECLRLLFKQGDLKLLSELEDDVRDCMFDEIKMLLANRWLSIDPVYALRYYSHWLSMDELTELLDQHVDQLVPFFSNLSHEARNQLIQRHEQKLFDEDPLLLPIEQRSILMNRRFHDIYDRDFVQRPHDFFNQYKHEFTKADWVSFLPDCPELVLQQAIEQLPDESLHHLVQTKPDLLLPYIKRVSTDLLYLLAIKRPAKAFSEYWPLDQKQRQALAREWPELLSLPLAQPNHVLWAAAEVDPAKALAFCRSRFTPEQVELLIAMKADQS